MEKNGTTISEFEKRKAHERTLLLTREHELLDAMEHRGGHFAKNLAVAWKYADMDNRAKLRVAFGSLLCSYEWALK